MWWDQTIARWHGEGCPGELRFSQVFDIAQYFGLDPYQQFWFSTTDPTIEATQHHVEGIVANMDDYLRIRPQLFPDHDAAIRGMAAWAERQRAGRGRGLVHAGGLLLVSPHADGLREADVRLRGSTGAAAPDQPGPAGVQLAPARPDSAGLRADFHDHRRGHVLQPRPDDLQAHLRRVRRARITASSCRGLQEHQHPAVHGHGRRRDPAGALARGTGHCRACCRSNARPAWTA